MYAQAAARKLADAALAYKKTVGDVEAVYSQLRDPAQPWQQAVMRLLDSHDKLLAAVSAFESAAFEVRSSYRAGDLNEDAVDALMFRIDAWRPWSEVSEGDTRVEATRLIGRHRNRLEQVGSFTAAR